MANPLIELQTFGQSLWYDNIQRGLIVSGQLKRMVDEDGVLGVTSNPTIFEKAIGSSPDYDATLGELAEAGQSVEQIYAALTIQDIQMATDVLRPVYERTDGVDGYVSIEVSPLLAHDTAGTIQEAHRLWNAIQRPNLMIKVPATPQGIPAVRALIGAGINVNVTLIFALAMYEQVMDAYIEGLEQLAAAGRPLEPIASVASFFISRVDTLVDKALDERIARATSPDEPAHLRGLQGKAAIANAKLAYVRFKELFGTARFAALAQKGARVQRPLWASTSTKNPAYRDVIYIEALIGPHTVNTAPPATILAFRDHGQAASTLEQDLDQAPELMDRLAEVGIDIEAVTDKLLQDGLKAFADSYQSLLQSIDQKRAQLGLRHRQAAAVGPLQAQVEQAERQLDTASFPQRLWKKDASLWKTDEQVQAEIRNRLGWLDAPQAMAARGEALNRFAAEIKAAGFTHALLLGMGGSSMTPELLRATCGVAPGYLDLHVLDTTDPASVLAAERAIDLPHTLFIVASKSGSTIEAMSFFKYFYDQVRAVRGQAAGSQFIAIADPGTSLETLAAEHGFRHTFLNPPDIGGRYSALSYFGLVPAALIGMDLAMLTTRALDMATACAPGAPVRHNPGVWLGARMGAMHNAGRDKLTLILSPQIAAFGYWLEQLIAESTGKEGKGILPVEGEPPGEPAAYGADRWFVYMAMEGDDTHQAAVRALEAAGQPVVTLRLRDVYDLGGEFFRWEIATAAAGALLNINPFDQPNVQESKANTRRLLAEYNATGCLPETMASLPDTAAQALTGLLQRLQPGDYVALLGYIQRTPEHDALLNRIRVALRDRYHVATTLGYGPRFLHSTGQLHKGGAANGVFIQITADPVQDVPIPGEKYTFGVLIAAQALGDLQALQARQRRVIRLHLPGDVTAGLTSLAQAIA